MKDPRDRFILEKVVVGPLEVNCYLVADPDTKEACLIDPGADPAAIKRLIARKALDLKFIVNTHGHGDHIAANGSFQVPIYIGSLDSDFLADPDKNLSSMFVFSVRSPGASRLLEDGERLRLGSLVFEVLHTPGHTPGSISLKINGIVFTGDALFSGSIGRTDFEYGDGDLLIRSIMKKLMPLDDDTVIYPGHGPSSTIGAERKSNQFLQ
jgi:glyoxylase-like metal-dependent hydrolase (beta-lactamase superfamily II)